MNPEEAKEILMFYRPDAPESDDPQMAEALALARQDKELAHWLENQCARQTAIRQKFRQISVPAGLREQIMAQHRAQERISYWRTSALQLAAAAMIAILIGLPFWLRPHVTATPDFANYQAQMAAVALRGYGMDVITNDPAAIHRYLSQNQAPADYALPAPLQHAELAGCAIENWDGTKVSMLCFRTGQPLPTGQQSDLWLFIIDRKSVPGGPTGPAPQLAAISRLATAAWNRDGKLYLLGTTADEAALRKFL